MKKSNKQHNSRSRTPSSRPFVSLDHSSNPQTLPFFIQRKNHDNGVADLIADKGDAVSETKRTQTLGKSSIHAEHPGSIGAAGGVKPIREISTPVIQRFEGAEHQQLGDAAMERVFGEESPQITDVNLAESGDDPRYLTFGEMVALSGDLFESPDQIRNKANSVDGRGEIRWALWWKVHEPAGREPVVRGDYVKERVRERYLSLARQNDSHFRLGGGIDTYEQSHIQALKFSYQAGSTNDSDRRSLLTSRSLRFEAFAQHFLSDQFAAGHIRTPSTEIRAWYDAHVDNQNERLIQHTANRLARLHSLLSPSGARERIVDALGDAADAMTLGNVVALAYHDYDNRQGLLVRTARRPLDEEQGSGVSTLESFQGQIEQRAHRFRALGDNNLGRSGATQNAAVTAMQASILELRQAFGEGESHTHDGEDLEQIYGARAPFTASDFIPEVHPDDTNTEMEWQWWNLNQPMYDAVDEVMKGRIATQFEESMPAEGAGAEELRSNFVAQLRRVGIRFLEDQFGPSRGQ